MYKMITSVSNNIENPMYVKYIPLNMHMAYTLLWIVVVQHQLILSLSILANITTLKNRSSVKPLI